jgi:hypothetical protein
MQERSVKDQSPNAVRLVLGLEARCLAYGDLAVRIDEQVGEELDVRSLRDPELQGWHAGTVDKEAAHAPTLFEINGDRVRVWEGWKMGWVLSRLVGPAATWEILQTLKEVRGTP